MRMPVLRAKSGAVLLSVLLTACGSNTGNLSGTAAVGAPLSAGVVELRCNNGRQVSVRTAEDGHWAASVPDADLPCVARVTTADGLNAFFAATGPANGEQTVNITPLTSLVVAHAIGAAPTATWFSGLDDAAREVLAAALPAAVMAVGQSLRDAGYGVPADFDPLGDALQARPGDAHDGWLEAFAHATAMGGRSYAQTAAQYVASGNLPLSETVNGIEVSGSWRVDGRDGLSRTLVPSPGGFWMTTDSQQNLTMLGFRQVSTGLANGMPLARIESVSVVLDAQGRKEWVAFTQEETGSPPVTSTCQDLSCPGVSVTRLAGGEITLNMRSVRAGDYVLNGSVSARAPRAVWRPHDLPRTSTGTLTINGETRELLAADVRMSPEEPANIQVTLDVGEHWPLTLWQYVVAEPIDGASPFRYQGRIGYYNEWLEFVGSRLVCEVQSDCGVTMARDEDGVLMTLNAAIFRDTSAGAQASVSGSIHVQPEYGLLEAAGIDPLLLESTEMYAHADGTLMLAVEGDNSLMLVTTRDGQVLSVEWRAGDPVSYRPVRLLCGRHYIPGATFAVPPCSGVTTDARGLTIDFANAELVDAEGEVHARVLVNGRIRSNGI